MRVMCNNAMINAHECEFCQRETENAFTRDYITNTHRHTNNDTLGHNDACSSGNKEMSQLIFRLLL